MSSQPRPVRALLAIPILAALLLAALPLAVAAQSTPASAAPATSPPTRPAALTISTPYPTIVVMAGEEATFPLTVRGPVDERVDLAIPDIPAGYDVSFRGGDAIVSSVSTNGQGDPPLELRVRVPQDAAAGTTRLTVSASAESGQASLPIDVVISDTDTGSVSLVSSYPVLSGDSDATFAFDLKLHNDTPRDLTFGLQGQGPDGWTVDVRPSGSENASTTLVTAGSSTNIKVTATPPRFVPAGQYVLDIVADGEGQVAQTNLGVEITGTYALGLDTVDGRLNTSVAAGDSGDVALVVTNTGTAPLTDIALAATTPTGWKVVFDPESVAALDPSATTQVKATVTPASQAVAGDYVLTLNATTADTSDSIQLRVTVETSSLWGIVAIAIIALALAGLFLIFRRYGRR
jgi:uncharacterized membrane protein